MKHACLLLAVLLTACTSAPPPTTQSGGPLLMRPITTRPADDGPRDPDPGSPLVAHLMVYQVSVPVGTISRNDKFWKHVDEQLLDSKTYDVLYRNGIRVGQAPNNDWAYFKQIIGQNQARSQSMGYVAADTRSIEVVMKAAVESQMIFDFDMRNHLTGRTYDDGSDNVMCLSFEPNRRKPGDLRVALCPMVRSHRKEFVVRPDGGSVAVDYVNPERYYRLDMAADIPLDHLMIVAPSPESRNAMSLGHAFFIVQGDAQELEQMLILVPRLYKAKEKGPAGAGAGAP